MTLPEEWDARRPAQAGERRVRPDAKWTRNDATTAQTVEVAPNQLSIFGQPSPSFDGDTVEPEDVPRLTGQLLAVARLVSDGRWWTLRELAEATGGSEASMSARLRDLKKARFGAHDIERRRVAGGLWQYRLRKGR